MKKYILLILPILIGSSIALWSSSSANTNQKNEVGRYQLVSGSYKVAAINGRESSFGVQQTVFKIDTITGRTWIFLTLASVNGEDTVYREGWKEVSKDY